MFSIPWVSEYTGSPSALDRTITTAVSNSMLLSTPNPRVAPSPFNCTAFARMCAQYQSFTIEGFGLKAYLLPNDDNFLAVAIQRGLTYSTIQGRLGSGVMPPAPVIPLPVQNSSATYPSWESARYSSGAMLHKMPNVALNATRDAPNPIKLMQRYCPCEYPSIHRGGVNDVSIQSAFSIDPVFVNHQREDTIQYTMERLNYPNGNSFSIRYVAFFKVRMFNKTIGVPYSMLGATYVPIPAAVGSVTI